MKILVMNGSARRGKSITLKITHAFLEGFCEADQNAAGGETATVEEINLYDKKISPCMADFSCWFKTPGECVIDDDVREIYERIEKADLVIWSMPLYVFGIPSVVAALLDRSMINLKPAIDIDERGWSTHPGFAGHPEKHMVIMSGAFPDTEGNFDGAVFQMRRNFGWNIPVITCPESTLLLYKKSEEILKLAAAYLETARQAGRQMRNSGKIEDETIRELNSCMMDRDAYIAFTNGR